MLTSVRWSSLHLPSLLSSLKSFFLACLVASVAFHLSPSFIHKFWYYYSLTYFEWQLFETQTFPPAPLEILSHPVTRIGHISLSVWFPFFVSSSLECNSLERIWPWRTGAWESFNNKGWLTLGEPEKTEEVKLLQIWVLYNNCLQNEKKKWEQIVKHIIACFSFSNKKVISTFQARFSLVLLLK